MPEEKKFRLSFVFVFSSPCYKDLSRYFILKVTIVFCFFTVKNAKSYISYSIFHTSSFFAFIFEFTYFRRNILIGNNISTVHVIWPKTCFSRYKSSLALMMKDESHNIV
jgi:hypothetical protein